MNANATQIPTASIFTMDKQIQLSVSRIDVKLILIQKNVEFIIADGIFLIFSEDQLGT
jgi:hypothetical protein